MKTGLMNSLKALTAAALIALQPMPAAAADPALEKLVVDGFAACHANRSKVTNAAETLQKAGWVSKGQGGGVRLYFAEGFKAVATLTPSYSKDNDCGFGIKGMNQKEAMTLASKIMRATFGKAVEIPKKDLDSDMVAAWVAETGEDVVFAVVMREVNYSPWYRGSMIIFGFLKK